MTTKAQAAPIAASEEESPGWLDAAISNYDSDPDFVAEGLAMKVIEDALKLMDKEGINRTELARRLGKSRAYVTRLFNAPPNLTLRSIAALAIALEAKPAVFLDPSSTLDLGQS